MHVQELIKTQNELKTEFKQMVQSGNTKIYKSLKDHMQLPKSQIKQTKVDVVTYMDQLHNQVGKPFSEQNIKFKRPKMYTI